MWLAAIQHQPHWHTHGRIRRLGLAHDDLATERRRVAGDIAWPTPQALRGGPLINYGYEGEALLPVPVTILAGFKARELHVVLRAEWLACKDLCVPESGEFALKIPTRSATVAHAKTFEDALSHLPQEPASVHARAVIERRALKVEVDGLPTAWRGRQLRLFVELPGVVEHAAAIEQRWDAERWVARVPLASQRSESPTTMHGARACGPATGVRTLLTITAGHGVEPVRRMQQ